MIEFVWLGAAALVSVLAGVGWDWWRASSVWKSARLRRRERPTTR